MHSQVRQFVAKVKEKYPDFFSNQVVLETGSVDINGHCRDEFRNCKYIGIDVAEAPKVDIAIGAHEATFPDGFFDVVYGLDHFEHDMYWKESFQNMYRMLRSGGLLFFSCAHEWYEHGTKDHGAHDSLTTNIGDEVWANYYKNLNSKDFLDNFALSEMFTEHEILETGPDLQFHGIKR